MGGLRCENCHNAHILFITDSSTVLSALATGHPKCPPIMTLLRVLFWYSVEFNLSNSSAYIRSEDNNICDSLSRLNDTRSNARLLNLGAADA